MDRHILSSLPAPKLDNLIEYTKRTMNALDGNTSRLVFDLFRKLQAIAACGDDERRELWLAVERGDIKDFGEYDDYFECGEVENREEFEALWLSYYPEPLKWYKLVATIHSDEKYRTVFLDGKQIIEIDQRSPKETEYEADHSELISWLLLSADTCIEQLKAGIYNDFISLNLPYRKRIGKLLRKEYWRIFPEHKDVYLESITPDEILLLAKHISEQSNDSPVGRLPEMTAGLFFDCCRLGYEANNYDGISELTPKELYYRHADGRDEGLKDVAEGSAKAFDKWYSNRRQGGHPWEVCRGGNSTHISLYANRDKRGWWLSLAGSSFGRSVETARIYLSLARHNIPVYLFHGKEIAAMLTGQDWIGIVPEGVYPRYCDSYFPNDDKMLQFMNLPEEETEAVIEAAVWRPIDAKSD